MTSRTLTFEFVRLPNRRSTFHSDLLAADSRRIVLAHDIHPSKPLIVDGIDVMAAGYHAVWFLFQGKPYDVARLYRPDGTFTGYYADVLEPVHWIDSDPNTLAPLVDLFLDLWVTPDGRYLVLDQDEFDAALERGALTPGQAASARETLRSMIAATVSGLFPPQEVRDYRPMDRGVER